MKFAKGQSGNPRGKPKGPHKSTRLAREAIATFVDGNAERLQGWLDEIAQEEGAKAAFLCFSSLLEYHIPKLGRTELAGDKDAPLTVQLVSYAGNK